MLDLFAGVGGLSVGLTAASDRFRVRTAVELEPRAAAGYALNHPEAEVHPTSIQEWLNISQVPEVNVVVGGPPCQGFSTLGKQNLEDPRNTMWQYYAKAVRLAQPSYFVLENVPQFLASPQYQLFEGMTKRGGPLAAYTFRHRIVNAADHGAAQKRKRAIVVGHHRDLPFPGFPAVTHYGPDSWRTVRDVIADVGPIRELPPGRERKDGCKSFAGPYRAEELHVGRRYGDLSLRRFAAIPEGGSRFDLPEDLKCEAWKGHRTGSTDVMGRLRWDRPSVTIRTEFTKPEKGRYLHPDSRELRAITPYEGALLQGFSPDHLFVGPITEIVKQIGNAVPVPLGQQIGRALVNAWDAVVPRRPELPAAPVALRPSHSADGSEHDVHRIRIDLSRR